MARFISLIMVTIATIGIDPRPAWSKSTTDAIAWETWSSAVFTRAQAEGRFVLLDLGAVWCHWCHVMEEITYRDPEVAALIAKKYIAVKVDQESDPELANRYEAYGWPATIVFGADGSEIVRRRGYIPPKPMASMLQAIIDDPSPGPSVTADAEEDAAASGVTSVRLSANAKRDLLGRYRDSSDFEHGGFGPFHRYVHPASVEYALLHRLPIAKTTLIQNLALLDPIWGGVYQYSDLANASKPWTHGHSPKWSSPHYEKIMWFQAENLRLYALAYAQEADPRYLDAATSIYHYLKEHLSSPEGAFYTSQDADLSPEVPGKRYFSLSEVERRKLGVPKIDTHVYARENGWAIRALAAYADATGSKEALASAVTAAEWIVAQRSLEKSGGFWRDEANRAPFLGDTLAMGQAFLALYGSTAERVWLDRAIDAARFIEQTMRDARAGYMAAVPSRGAIGVLKKPVLEIDENIAVARFANLLARVSGRKELHATAEHAMRYLTSARVLETRRMLVGLVLLDEELGSDPLHVTIVGPKGDPAAERLFAAARAFPASYRRIEWWDPAGAALMNPDVRYPKIARPAAFACSGTSCSPPIFQPEQARPALDRLTRLRAAAMTVP